MSFSEEVGVDFELDEDQLGLQEAAAAMLAKECPASYLRSVVDDDHDPADLWKTLGGLDWPGLAIPVEHGGSGASAVELAIVVEQLGYVGDPTPFLATTTQFVPLVAACGDVGQRSRFLGAVAGEAQAGTLALAGPNGRWDPHAPPIEARRSPGGWRLHGTASFVLDADRVAELAVPARTPEGVQVFVVPADGARIARLPSFDGALHVTEVVLDGVEVGDDRRLAGGPVETVEAVPPGARWPSTTRSPAWRWRPSAPASGRSTWCSSTSGTGSSSACRSARSRRSSTRPSTCTSPSSGPGRSATSRP